MVQFRRIVPNLRLIKHLNTTMMLQIMNRMRCTNWDNLLKTVCMMENQTKHLHSHSITKRVKEKRPTERRSRNLENIISMGFMLTRTSKQPNERWKNLQLMDLYLE